MSRLAVASVVTSSLLGLTLVASTYDAHRPAFNLATSLATLPEAIQDWRSDGSLAVDARTRELLAASEYLARIYHRDRSDVELFVAFYALQSPGVGPHAARNCLSESWEITTTPPAQLQSEDGAVPVNRLLVRRMDTERLVLYWYQTPNRIVHDEYARKFFVAWDAVLSGHKAGAFVRLIVANEPREEQRALAFGAEVARELHRRLGSVVRVAGMTDDPDTRFLTARVR